MSLLSYFRQAPGKGAGRRREAPAETFTWSVPTYRQSVRALEFELRRCRRYEHPLTLLLVGTDEGADRHGNGQGRRAASTKVHATPISFSPSEVFFLLGSLLGDTVRETDIVCYAAEDHLYAVLLPETSEAEAGLAMRRLGRVFAERAQLTLSWSVAEFPKDGFSIQDLLDSARNAWQRALVQPVMREASHG